jgi:calcium-dependent protein kinase
MTHVFGYPRDLSAAWTLGPVLGAGSCGVVRRATAADGSGRVGAVKTIAKVPRRGAATPRHLLKLRSEVDVMRQLGPSLDAVALLDAYEDDASVHLVMECCDGGGVLDRARAGRLSERGVARVARAVLRFLAQAHAKRIVFRDVKPDNFLFLSDDDAAPVRATDFGLAARLPAPGPDGGEPVLTSRTGTPVYMSPECVRQHYGTKADVWSAGVLIYQLLTGRLPFWESVSGEGGARGGGGGGAT